MIGHFGGIVALSSNEKTLFEEADSYPKSCIKVFDPNFFQKVWPPEARSPVLAAGAYLIAIRSMSHAGKEGVRVSLKA